MFETIVKWGNLLIVHCYDVGNLQLDLTVTWLQSLREKCPYSELFWFTFSRFWTEYEEIRIISPYSVQMRENADQNNSEYGHFLRSEFCSHVF